MLHDEEIELESKQGAPGDETQSSASTKVVFSSYTGIAPRQYQRLFSMSGRGKKVLLALKDWDIKKATLAPRHLVHNAFASYLMGEREELARLPTDGFAWDPAVVCPPQR